MDLTLDNQVNMVNQRHVSWRQFKNIGSKELTNLEDRAQTLVYGKHCTQLT